MVAYNFQARFADAVENGLKRQTIRARGKRRHAKPGDAIQLYTGMRTKSCRKLGDATCLASVAIVIDRNALIIAGTSVYGWHRTCRARDDGFDSFDSMVDWFEQTHGLPFRGELIKWGELHIPVSENE